MTVWARSRGFVFGLLGILALGGAWELYKVIGPSQGWGIGDTLLLPRANNGVMPHVWDMIAKFGQPIVAFQPDGATVGGKVVSAFLYTLRLSAAGWVLGCVIGFALALVMTRSRLAEAAALPWVVASQTVPLIAIAPVLGGWGQFLHVGDWQWGKPQSIIVISAYLAFVPLTVGALRGLKSPTTAQLELMHVYGVGWWRTLLRLRLPASVPYLLPALRLSATSAVIGAVVAEVSIGQDGGVGRLIIDFTKDSYTQPAKAWPPIFGAVAVGLVAAGVVGIIGLLLRRYRRGEQT